MALEEWQQKNRGRLEGQQQRARRIDEQNNLRPLPVPETPLMPGGASPELKVFLTERHALLLERGQMQAHAVRLDAAGQRCPRFHL